MPLKRPSKPVTKPTPTAGKGSKPKANAGQQRVAAPTPDNASPPNRRAFRARSGRGSDAPTPPPTHAPDPDRTLWADDPDKRFRFDADRRARFLLHLRGGAAIDTACDRIGCSPNTPRDWATAGRAAHEKELRGEALTEREREQLQFADEYRAAQAEVDTRLLAQIVTQSAKDWRAAAHLLAIKDPKRYSERYAVRMLQVEADAPVREAEREGKELANQLMAEKIAAIKEVRERGGRLMVVGAEDVFDAIMHSDKLTDEARNAMLTFFKSEGFRFVIERDLGAEPEGSEPMQPT